MLGYSWVRYVLVGGFAYLCELLLVFSLIKGGLNSVSAVAVAFWFGFLISFLLQKVFAFRSKTRSKKHLTRQVVLHSMLVLFNYLFTIFITWLLTPYIGLFPSRTLALAMTILWNFYAYSSIIFKDKE